MAGLIEDYAMIGDMRTAALVCKDGSIDWLCFPRFDSSACFASLLGAPENGRWLMAPTAEATIHRRYRPGTLILETTFATKTGKATLIDFMPVEEMQSTVIRLVIGEEGTVRFRTDLVIRFDYGSIVPWMRKLDGRMHAVAGPDALVLTTPLATRGKDLTTVADFMMSLTG